MIRSAKATARARIVGTLDGLVRQLVFARDGHECVRCGRPARLAQLQAAHIRTKGRYSRLRFELLNVITLCLACHLYWWHREPGDAYRWLEQKYPGRWDQLDVLSAVAPKVDYKQLLTGLKLEVDQLP